MLCSAGLAPRRGSRSEAPPDRVGVPGKAWRSRADVRHSAQAKPSFRSTVRALHLRMNAGGQNLLAEMITWLILSVLKVPMQIGFDPDFLILLYDVARQMRTRSDQRARTRGMTRAQWVILAHLERQPGLSQNELAAIVEVEPITIGRLVDRLENRGLVERRADPKDRRVWRLQLLPAAAPILREIKQYRAEL